MAQQELFKLAVVQNRVTLEVREALMTLDSARASCGARRGLEAAASEQELARERFSILSSSSNLELTNALFSLARSRDNAIDALYRLNAARINLLEHWGKWGDL